MAVAEKQDVCKVYILVSPAKSAWFRPWSLKKDSRDYSYSNWAVIFRLEMGLCIMCQWAFDDGCMSKILSPFRAEREEDMVVLDEAMELVGEIKSTKSDVLHRFEEFKWSSPTSSSTEILSRTIKERESRAWVESFLKSFQSIPKPVITEAVNKLENAVASRTESWMRGTTSDSESNTFHLLAWILSRTDSSLAVS